MELKGDDISAGLDKQNPWFKVDVLKLKLLIPPILVSMSLNNKSGQVTRNPNGKQC